MLIVSAMKTQKFAAEAHHTNDLVHSNFAVFTSPENAAHFTLVNISQYYEFGSTPCIHYLISINLVLVIGYMHAIMFIVFSAR
jgi:hypothetical protein